MWVLKKKSQEMWVLKNKVPGDVGPTKENHETTAGFSNLLPKGTWQNPKHQPWPRRRGDITVPSPAKEKDPT